MPYGRDLDPSHEELFKIPHHSTGHGVLKILPLALPAPRHALILRDKVLGSQILTVAYHEFVHQMPVQLLKVTHQTGFTILNRVQEPKIWLQLRLNHSPVNLPRQNLIGQVEQVVHPIIGLELPPPLGSQFLWQQPEYLPEVALRVLTLYTRQLLPEGIQIR